MSEVWVVLGEYSYDFSEVVSVWASEALAKGAAERAENELDYDYVTVHQHEVHNA
jgi:hypothetical protein